MNAARPGLRSVSRMSSLRRFGKKLWPLLCILLTMDAAQSQHRNGPRMISVRHFGKKLWPLFRILQSVDVARSQHRNGLRMSSVRHFGKKLWTLLCVLLTMDAAQSPLCKEPRMSSMERPGLAGPVGPRSAGCYAGAGAGSSRGLRLCHHCRRLRQYCHLCSRHSHRYHCSGYHPPSLRIHPSLNLTTASHPILIRPNILRFQCRFRTPP